MDYKLELWTGDIKVIVGQERYLRSIGDYELHVKVDTKLLSETEYMNFDTIAFLVNDWIKVCDSLEMIFNLIFGTENSVLLISKLKRKKISPNSLAHFLYTYHGILLVNEKNNKSETNISSLECIDKALIVGKEVKCLSINVKTGSSRCMHPSGNNLREDRTEEYYKTWYLHDDSCLETVKGNGVSFVDFKIL